ncbi:FEKKY domain-containing protein [Kaistella polysaccharea]|uniref:FEKKY domain-containing protein n=1 Tax=Kaistella polysaccharea TaxID=2878534 RepID=UPI001CF45B9F|nr:hypothetical protein [Kaistella polysaccharea]
MKAGTFLSSFIILFLISCTSKTPDFLVINDLNSSLDQLSTSEGKDLKAGDFLMYATEKNLEFLLKEKRASFVVFGLATNDYSDFENKYGIKVKTENCVISPGISQIATENNKLISDYLTSKYKDEWKTDLNFVPFGLD